MITLEMYWMGRDAKFPGSLTEVVRKNAEETVRRANRLLGIYVAETGDKRQRAVASGWRPAEVNATVKGAAKKSNHMTGRAVDIADASGTMKKWLMTNRGQLALIECGLWMEHPEATPTWVHVQIVPPLSGNRVFRP